MCVCVCVCVCVSFINEYLIKDTLHVMYKNYMHANI